MNAVSVNTTKSKRGPGRPRKVFDLETERARTKAAIEQRRSEHLGLEKLDVEDHIKKVLSLSHRNKLSKAEVDELRETHQTLYEQFLQTQWKMEEIWNERFVSAARDAAIEVGLANPEEASSPKKLMSWEDWCKEHRLRPQDGKRKPGPPKKKPKAVWDLEPGERGTASEPSEPIDVDALEQKFIEQYIQDKEEEQQFPKGGRLRNDHRQLPKRSQQQNFWY